MTDVVILALAINCLVDVWLKGDIFATRRAIVESWQHDRPEFAWNRMTDWLREAWLCPYCVSFHVGLAVVLLWWLAYPLAWPLLCGLAAIRLAWIVNGLLPERLRYERD